MVSSDALLFIFSLFDSASLLFLAVFFIITLSDLECDYLNATSCCSRLNTWVLPEIIAHTIVLVLLLFNFHWILFCVNLPLAAYEIYRYINIPSGNTGLYDPTEIHNRGQLKSYMKEAMVKLAFHLVFFFIYLYSMILALLSRD
ncbi:protein cornichon homolog 4-like [Saccoglossus kowalevskii]|uniref:Protein cornichon homolog 4-like n=1 Tax=Saccoglossus kowalevskii TaxID=10224 RepID=A0ABM0GZH0_SACKO|nr:PREDICTED: protein cornichon homolog 4-like [Saccoglossus kowalevskii]